MKTLRISVQPELTDDLLAALAQSYCQVFGPDSEWREIWTQEKAIAEMKRKGRTARGAIPIVLFIDETPVGFLAAMPVEHSGRADDLAKLDVGEGSLYLAEIIVVPYYQRKGLGRLMLSVLAGRVAGEKTYQRTVCRDITEMQRKGFRIELLIEGKPIGLPAATTVEPVGRADDVPQLVETLAVMVGQEQYRKIVCRTSDQAAKARKFFNSKGFAEIGRQQTHNTTGGFESNRVVLALDLNKA